MARYRTWKTSQKDLDEYREAFEAASQVVSRAETAMREELGYTKMQVERSLPELGSIETGDSLQSLNAAFTNRADFQREMRYLQRVIDSESARVPKDFAPMTYEARGTLTAGRLDEATGRFETAFMERERSLTRRRENDAALRKLKESGVEMVRVPVLDADGKQMTDKWRHKLYTYVSATPANERLMRAIQDKDPSARYTPDEAASQGYVMRHGDLVKLGDINNRRFTPHQIYQSLHVEKRDDMKNHLYFANYANIAEATLVKPLADELTGYIDRIQKLPYAQRDKIYRLIEYSESEYAQLEFYYHDTETSSSIKLSRLFKFWRGEILPQIEKFEGKEEQAREEAEEILPVTPNEPEYTHIKGGADMAAGGNENPTVFESFQQNARERGYHKLNRKGKPGRKLAKGITLHEIEDLFYGIAGLTEL